MNRRQVILIVIFIVAVALTVKWWRWVKPVNLAVLAEKKELIAELAETIIPRTDTPGAKDARVAEFILEMVQHGISSQEQRTFVRGLNDIDQYCRSQFKHDFVASTLGEKTQTLVYFEKKGHGTSSRFLIKVKNKLMGRPFFTLLRQLTVVGYCTSEVGATQGLAYDYVPKHYEPCIKLIKGQRAWATA